MAAEEIKNMPQPFSDAVMEHFLHPRHVGTLEAPSGEGVSGSPQVYRYMRMQLLLDGDIVREACFKTYGCVPVIAAGSWVTEWAHNRSLDEALALTPADVVKALDIPKERAFAADMAVRALHRALADARTRTQNAAATEAS